MAKIEHLTISHFRGIDSFKQSFTNGLTCIIGRGDSGKSSILDAIALLFSQSWGVHLNDSDFYNCDTTIPIIIESVVSGFPDDFLVKYNSHVRGLLSNGLIEEDMESDAAVDAEPVLTIRLTVGKDLEPSWEIVSYHDVEPTVIKATDRAKLNVFVVSDYTDRHFSMNKGNPLYSLYRQLNGDAVLDEGNKVLDVVREAKAAFDDSIGTKFDVVIEKIKKVAATLGITLDEMKAMLDHKDIAISENKVSIHENGIPFRLKGKGSKRLLSLAIQLAITQPSGVILIDEIEQGLEPDRVQHLVNVLSSFQDKQVIITTHSSNVAVEIPCTSLFIMRHGAKCLLHVEGEIQGSIRRNPEAFFAAKVLVCEGATEIGFCRAVNAKRVQNGKTSAACKGVRFADGNGLNMAEYVLGFKGLLYTTALFCDSDANDINEKKQQFIENGITVIDCEDSFSIEEQIFKDVPWNVVQELISIAIHKVEQDNAITKEEAEKSVFDSVNSFLANNMAYTDGWCAVETEALRTALGKAAKKKYWYKRQSYGEQIGNIIMAHFDELPEGCRLKQEILSISNWIDA